MKVNILLLNGCPRSGKDTVAKIAKKLLEGKTTTTILKFTGLMDDVARLVLNLNRGEYHEWREARKDEKLMHYDTVMRKFLISMSEDWLKPHLGSGIMGYHAALKVIDHTEKHWSHSDSDLLFIFSDCGFQEEFGYFKNTLDLTPTPDGVEFNVQLAQVHRDGCTFDNDSREWVTDGGDEVRIDNNSSIEYLQDLVVPSLIKEML